MIFTTFKTIDTEIFDKLFADSKDELDSGTYSWHMYPEKDDQQKKAHIYERCNLILSQPNSVAWLVTHEDQPVLMGFGIKEGDYINFIFILVGKDPEGSKAWLYNPELRPAREAFWESQGVKGWVIPASNTNSSVKAHVNNRLTNYAGSDYSVESKSENVLHHKITVTKE